MAPKLPKFLLTRKPGKAVLDRCGWNDWYNYGDYVNNFEILLKQEVNTHDICICNREKGYIKD